MYKIWTRNGIKGVRSCHSISWAMFPGMTAKKLLTADFKKLVDVYFHYRNYINGLTDIQAKEVNDAAKKVFTCFFQRQY